MKKNGTFFLSVMPADSLRAGVWNPYAYREEMQSETLEHFASVQKLQGRSYRVAALKYSPIEFREIKTDPISAAARFHAETRRDLKPIYLFKKHEIK